MSTLQNEAQVLTNKKVELDNSSFRLIFNHETKRGCLAVTSFALDTTQYAEPVFGYSDLVKLKNMIDQTLEITDTIESEKLTAALMHKEPVFNTVPWYRKVTQYLTGVQSRKKYSNTLSK